VGIVLVEEHNHGKLWIGFAISFFMFGVAVFLAFTMRLAEELFNQLFIAGVSLMVLVASILMLRGVFQKRDECPICKDKYKFGKKKNE
jgi:apolipoprotein N-acyltransferase